MGNISKKIYPKTKGKSNSGPSLLRTVDIQYENNIGPDIEFRYLKDTNEAYIDNFLNCDNMAFALKVIEGRLKYIFIMNSAEDILVITPDNTSISNRAVMDRIFNSEVQKVFVEGKSVLKVLKTNGINISGPYFDIYIADAILNAGLNIKSGYDDIQKRLLGSIRRNYLNWAYNINSAHMREEYENLCIMLKLKHIIESKLNEKGLHDTSRLEFDCISSVVELEASGIQFDIKKYSSLIGDIESKVSSLEKQIAGLLGRVNIAADGEVIEVLKSYKGLEEIKTIGDLTLLPQDEYPVVKVYLQYMNLKHLLQKYNLDFLKNISKNDGRVYASYSQVGSSTGRIYCANPNLQQIPRMGEFRECFIPREGCKLIRADYSQIELRIAAEISEDAVMIDAFKRGQDIHRFTASVIKNKVYDEVTDEERQAAKPINFGLIYGMGERGLIEYAWNAFGVRLSLEEAVKFNNLFFKKFTGIARWQVSIYRHSHNESRTIGGRLRVWEKIPSITELYNTPVQGTGADILKRALSKLYDRLKGLNTSIVLIVHDEILLEAPGTIAQGVKDILLQCMVEAGKEYLRKVPVKVEAVIGNSWADRQNQIC